MPDLPEPSRYMLTLEPETEPNFSILKRPNGDFVREFRLTEVLSPHLGPKRSEYVWTETIQKFRYVVVEPEARWDCHCDCVVFFKTAKDAMFAKLLLGGNLEGPFGKGARDRAV